MRIGINGSNLIALGRPASEIVEHAVAAEAEGFSSYWLAQLSAPDALTVLGAIGGVTSTIELGTAVIPTWPRHPAMLAAQALTVQDLCGGRLALGIGLAHKLSVEATWKIPFERPAHHMKEYLDVLLPLLSERRVSVEGDTWSAELEGLGIPADVQPPQVVLAAMGPRMLEMAGARTAGSILWLSGPVTIEEYIAPALAAAAPVDGDPRVIASVPVCVTDDPAAVRGAIAAILDGYNELPSYRRVMDREGAAGPEDVSIVGDEAEVRSGLERFEAAGSTDFAALEFFTTDEEATRTRALLRELT